MTVPFNYAGLVERLRAHLSNGGDGDHADLYPINPDGEEAATAIEALEARVGEMERERDTLERAVIDASNGAFPPQGQADPDDSTDGLAWFVAARQSARARSARQGGEG